MFTGIVEELGTVAGVEDQGDAIRLTIHAEHVLADAGLGDSISVNGCCLTVAERDGDTWTADVMQETLDKTSLAGVAAGRPGQPRARGHAADPARRPHRAGPRRRRRASSPPDAQRALGGRRGRRCRPSWRRYLVDKGSITVDGVSLTVVEARRRRVHGEPDPRDPRPHHARQPAARRPGQPRGRRHRQARREAAAASTGKDAVMTEPQHVGVRMDPIERAVADIAAGKAVVVVDDEGRENEGDLIFAASKATPELMAFTIRYSSGVICVPMPGDDAGPARDPADDAAQQGPDADGVHDLGRRPRRRHHRHLGRRPRAHRPGAGRLGDRAVGDHPARPRLPAALPRGRRAGPARPHRGRGRPGPDGRADPGRRAGRGRQRRRHDEAGRPSCASSPTSTAWR